jgi:hypothetical protein
MSQSNLGFNVSSLEKGALSLLGESGSKVIFRTNVTPDITIDVSGLMKAKAGEVPVSDEVPVSSDDKALLRVIRPEVTLRAVGSTATYAPYGPPRKEFLIILGLAVVASGLVGAKIAWSLCKKV